MKSLAALTTAALLLGGCQTYTGPTTATGTVVDRHTGQPIANARVDVGLLSGGWAGGSGSQPGTVADGQGRFSLSFEADGDHDYTLFASTPRGYQSNYGDAPLLKGGHQNDNLLVKAAAPAWVKIACVDDPPLGKVGLTTSGYSYSPTGISDNQYVGPGNFSFVRPIQSYFTDSIYWRIIDAKAQVTSGWLPVKTTAFDTATVTIHF